MQNSMIKAKRNILSCIAILLVSLCSAQWTMAASEKEILGNLSAVRPDLNFEFVGAAALPGFYAVQVRGGPLLYVSADGGHFFDGNFYQITRKQFVDVRELALNGTRRDVFATRGTDDLIVFKPTGQTKAIINVFTDVDCYYCQKLHLEMADINALGIEVRYLAFPRAGLGSPSYQVLVDAWCAENTNEYLTEAKLRSHNKQARQKSPKACENPVMAHYNLGQEIGVNGTPAIVFESGELLPGYLPANELAKRMGML